LKKVLKKIFGGNTFAAIYILIFIASMIFIGAAYSYYIGGLLSTHKEYQNHQEVEMLSTITESMLLGIHSSINQLANSSDARQLSSYNITKDILESERAVEINRLIHNIRTTLLLNNEIDNIVLYLNKSSTVFDTKALHDATGYFVNKLRDIDAFFMWNSILNTSGYRNPLVLRGNDLGIDVYQRIPLGMFAKASGVIYAHIPKAALDSRFAFTEYGYLAFAILGEDNCLVYESNNTEFRFNYADTSSNPDDSRIYESRMLSLDGLRLVVVYENIEPAHFLGVYITTLLLIALLGIIMVFSLARRQKRHHSEMLLATGLDYTNTGVGDYKRICEELTSNMTKLRKFANLPQTLSLSPLPEKPSAGHAHFTIETYLKINKMVLCGDYEGLGWHIAGLLDPDSLRLTRAALLRIASLYPSPECREVAERLLFADTPAQLQEHSRALCGYFDKQPASQDRLRDSIIIYIDDNIFDPGLSLKTISSRFNVSNSFVTKVVGEARGCGFLKYITDQKILEAKDLLLGTSDTVESIAKKCGLRDSAALIRHFKATAAMTPGEFRKRNGGAV